MDILTKIKDHRIKATNVLVEVTMEEYLKIAADILNENEFQRKKVINSQISSLLIEDILIGCSIPPLVLAVNRDILNEGFDYETVRDEDINEIIIESFSSKNLLILDGKQRTHIFSKLYSDLSNEISKGKEESVEKLKAFLSNKLRIEIYVGINKLNILYRMLTLNSGQTTMSTRHLMEMLYLDYLTIPFDGITLIPDKDDEKVSNNTSEYQFKEILDGFTSYLDKDENPFDRSEILDNIKSAKNIKHEDDSKNLFELFVTTYKDYLDKINELSGGFIVQKEELLNTEYEVKGLVFGATAIEVFKRSQAISGFGAAIGELKDIRENFDLEKVKVNIQNIKFSSDSNYKESILYLIKHFDIIKDKSKKIGNDQRFYFKYLFRFLFDPESNYPSHFDKAVEYAFKKTREEKLYISK